MNKKLVLQRLKSRYFRPVHAYPNGHLNHHGDCHIFRAIEIYGWAPCSCGLIHDLRWYPEELAEKVYPKYGADHIRSESLWQKYDETTHQYLPPEPIPQAEVDKLLEILKSQGIKVINSATYEKEDWEILQKDMADWAVIEEIFGTDYTERCKVEYTKIKADHAIPS